MQSRFDIQDELYQFPYHYLAHCDDKGAFRIHRSLSWGMEYLNYMSFVCALIAEHKPQSLLDIGCGDGRLSNMVRGFLPRLTGVDLSEKAISFALAFNPGCDFRCIDVAKVEDYYQWITLLEVLEHIPDEILPLFIGDIAARLERGGYLLLSVPTLNRPLNKKHYRHYDLRLLESQLSPVFEIVQHWWIWRCGLGERLLGRLMHNPLYVLNNGIILKMLSNIESRFNRGVNASNAGHLVCLAQKRSA